MRVNEDDTTRAARPVLPYMIYPADHALIMFINVFRDDLQGVDDKMRLMQGNRGDSTRWYQVDKDLVDSARDIILVVVFAQMYYTTLRQEDDDDDGSLSLLTCFSKKKRKQGLYAVSARGRGRARVCAGPETCQTVGSKSRSSYQARVRLGTGFVPSRDCRNAAHYVLCRDRGEIICGESA
jgi:hypothetical protein